MSENKLQNLPEKIGNLINLRELNILDNKHLKELPKSICKARNLNKLELNGDNFIYPPSSVMGNGTEAILKFIANGESIYLSSYNNLEY